MHHSASTRRAVELMLLALLSWSLTAAWAQGESASSALPAATSVGTGWERSPVSDDDIIIHTRPGPGDTRSFYGVTRLRTSLSSLVAVLLDRDRAHAWSFRVRSVETLPNSTPTHGFARMISSVPWPLTERETVYEWRLAQSEQTGTVTIEVINRPDLLPPDDRFVRIQRMASTWHFTPLPGQQVEVSFLGHGEPGGNLDSPVLKAFVQAAVAEAPLVTLRGLRRAVLASRYREARFSFVREVP
jgi:hypothetical protein